MEELRTMKNKTPHRIARALQTLPQTLDATYERILLGFERDGFAEVVRALQWIAFSPYVPTVERLAKMMSVNPDETDLLNEETRVQPEAVFELLSSLVAVHPTGLRCDACNEAIEEQHFHCYSAAIMISAYVKNATQPANDADKELPRNISFIRS
jgi:hypothetical protein